MTTNKYSEALAEAIEDLKDMRACPPELEELLAILTRHTLCHCGYLYPSDCWCLACAEPDP